MTLVPLHNFNITVISWIPHFINSTPHMNLVFGPENREFIRKRVAALKASPLFAGMEMTTDPTKWVFRRIVTGDSGLSCPLIPAHRAHPFRSIVTDFGLGRNQRSRYRNGVV